MRKTLQIYLGARENISYRLVSSWRLLVTHDFRIVQTKVLGISGLRRCDFIQLWGNQVCRQRQIKKKKTFGLVWVCPFKNYKKIGLFPFSKLRVNICQKKNQTSSKINVTLHLRNEMLKFHPKQLLRISIHSIYIGYLSIFASLNF